MELQHNELNTVKTTSINDCQKGGSRASDQGVSSSCRIVSYDTIHETPINPTTRNYEAFDRAYGFFNQALFNGKLPPCLLTIQRKNKAYGFFTSKRFSSSDHREITDEIALNPTYFDQRTVPEVLSTLVHEMVHLWQHHFGQASRGGYHNKQWAAHMKSIGLIPSDTGQPGGSKPGKRSAIILSAAAYLIWRVRSL